jgi:hypothetical protein
LKKLLKKLKEEQERLQKKGWRGKEEDVLLRIFSDMVRRNLINEEIIKDINL